MTNEIKSNIIRDLQGNVLGVDHYTIRMFSCWLDGSYLGEDHFRQNMKRIGECEGNRKKLRSFIIREFTSYIAHDAACSYGYAQKVLVEHLGLDTLNKLNDRLINWAINFHAEQVNPTTSWFFDEVAS